MNAEEQRKYRRQLLRQRRRRIRRIKKACRILLATLLVGIAITFVMQSYKADSEVSAGQLREQMGEEYPDSLITLLEKNPETKQFVLDYPKNKDKHQEIDLSDEVQKGTIPLFLQWDERWGYETYGNDFLAVTGCGPTCLSMVWCGLSGGTEWDPYSVAQFAEKEGYYVKGAGSAWDLMTSGAEDLGLMVDSVVFDADHILEKLQSGNPVICVMRPGDFTTSGHFIVLSGVDEDGKVKVCDPNSKENSDKTWDVEDLIPQIKNLWSYRYEA